MALAEPPVDNDRVRLIVRRSLPNDSELDEPEEAAPKLVPPTSLGKPLVSGSALPDSCKTRRRYSESKAIKKLVIDNQITYTQRVKPYQILEEAFWIPCK